MRRRTAECSGAAVRRLLVPSCEAEGAEIYVRFVDPGRPQAPGGVPTARAGEMDVGALGSRPEKPRCSGEDHLRHLPLLSGEGPSPPLRFLRWQGLGRPAPAVAGPRHPTPGGGTRTWVIRPARAWAPNPPRPGPSCCAETPLRSAARGKFSESLAVLPGGKLAERVMPGPVPGDTVWAKADR